MEEQEDMQNEEETIKEEEDSLTKEMDKEKLMEEIRKLKNENKELKNENKELKKENKELKNENKQIQKDKEVLNYIVQEQAKREAHNLKAIEHIYTDRDRLNDESCKYQEENMDLKKKVSSSVNLWQIIYTIGDNLKYISCSYLL